LDIDWHRAAEEKPPTPTPQRPRATHEHAQAHPRDVNGVFVFAHVFFAREFGLD